MTQTKPLPSKRNKTFGTIIMVVGLFIMVIPMLALIFGIASGVIPLESGESALFLTIFVSFCCMLLALIGHRLAKHKWLPEYIPDYYQPSLWVNCQ